MKILEVEGKKLSEVFTSNTKTVTLTLINYEKCTGAFVVGNQSYCFTYEAGDSDKKLLLLQKLKVNVKTGVVTAEQSKKVQAQSRSLHREGRYV